MTSSSESSRSSVSSLSLMSLTDPPVSSLSLLSLTGKAEDVLLLYVASGEGGLKALLNLRQVCKTTKLWVDRFPLRRRKQIFGRCEAVVDLENGNLKEFLENPPPPGVTSLFLTATEHFSCRQLPPDIRHLWSLFDRFWNPTDTDDDDNFDSDKPLRRLESLEINGKFSSDDLRLRSLCSSPVLQTFRCFSLDHLPEDQLDLFNFLFFQVEELSLGLLDWRQFSSDKRPFFRRLASNRSLKHLEVIMRDLEDCAGLTTFINLRSHDTTLRVTLKLDAPATNRIQGRFYSNLVAAIATSFSSIRIVGMNGQNLRELGIDVDEQTAHSFGASIESIKLFILFGEEDWRFAILPNLRRVILGVTEPNRLHVVVFPPRLQQLTVFRGFPPPTSLPQSLTSLNLLHFTATLGDLLGSITSLAQHCQSLETLSLRWTHHTEVPHPTAIHTVLFPHVFTKLKSLTVEIDFSSTNKREAALGNVILLDALKVPLLSLNHFAWTAKKPDATPNLLPIDARELTYPMLDQTTLMSFIRGKVSKTLRTVSISKNLVAEDATLLLPILELIVAENKLSRIKTHGRERNKDPKFEFK